MVVNRCVRIIPILLAYSTFLVQAQKKCAPSFKGQDNGHPHVMAPYLMELNKCVYEVVVPDYVCQAPKGANNLGVGVTACAADSPPRVEIDDDLVHLRVYSNCSYDEGGFSVTVYCKNDTMGRVKRQIGFFQPMLALAGMKEVIPQVSTGLQRAYHQVQPAQAAVIPRLG